MSYEREEGRGREGIIADKELFSHSKCSLPKWENYSNRISSRYDKREDEGRG